MREDIVLYFGVFGLMALSNAIVPVLPLIAAGPAVQGIIYSAYFLGALVSTLPTGLLCDRFGETFFIRSGLLLTVLSGIFLLMASSSPFSLVIARVIEGIGAGLLVASALSWLNRQPDHQKMTGYFMALLNAGLVIGLIGGGGVASIVGVPDAGLMLFLILTAIPFLASLLPGGAKGSVLRSGRNMRESPDR